MKKAEITFEQLEQNEACGNKLAFKELFGEKAVITPELARKHATEFDWDWAVRHLLPEKMAEQWSKLMRSYRVRFRADVEIANYNLKYTRSGLRRHNITEKQKKLHKDLVDALQRDVREKEAEIFARLYMSRGRIKPPKTEKLMNDLTDKMGKLVREIYESNEKDQFISDHYELVERVESIVYQVSRRVSGTYRAMRDESRVRAREVIDVDENPFD